MAPKRILVVCNSEPGFSNVFLAVLPTILSLDPEVEFHFLSFAPLATSLESTWTNITNSGQTPQKPSYHFFQRAESFSKTSRRVRTKAWEVYSHPGGIGNAFQIGRATSTLTQPWETAEYVDLFEQTRHKAESLQPDLVLVDHLFSPGWTAIRATGLPMIHVMPNALLTYVVDIQPRAAMLWKYPAYMTRLPFPLPWFYIPYNVCVIVLFLLGFMSNSRHGRLIKEIQTKAGVAPLTPADLMHSTVQESVIMGGGRAVDLPIEVVPSHVLPCGPLIRSAPPIHDTDAKLNEWLERGPTILIVLGQLALWSEARAVKLAKSLRILLENGMSVGGKMTRLQVLWKLRRDGSYSLGPGSAVHSIIGKEIDCDQVRITEWIAPEPIAILEHPNVICYVNHGGAGAFNDAVCSGVPQITISLWQDTYEFARRVEYLGVGRAGAEKAKDWFDAEELGSTMRDVILGARAEEFQAKARRLAQICDAEQARKTAAEEILRRLYAGTDQARY